MKVDLAHKDAEINQETIEGPQRVTRVKEDCQKNYFNLKRKQQKMALETINHEMNLNKYTSSFYEMKLNSIDLTPVKGSLDESNDNELRKRDKGKGGKKIYFGLNDADEYTDEELMKKREQAEKARNTVLLKSITEDDSVSHLANLGNYSSVQGINFFQAQAFLKSITKMQRKFRQRRLNKWIEANELVSGKNVTGENGEKTFKVDPTFRAIEKKEECVIF